VHRTSGSAAEQEVRCGGAIGSGARGSTAPWGLGLGFPGIQVPLFVGRRNGPACSRAQGLAGILGRPVRVGEEKEKGEEDDVRALAGRGRKRERGESARAGVRGRLGQAWPTWGEGGRGKREMGRGGRRAGPRGRRGKGRPGCCWTGPSSPFPFPFLFLFLISKLTSI
jgi:hypothetical protein